MICIRPKYYWCFFATKQFGGVLKIFKQLTIEVVIEENWALALKAEAVNLE
jgi:hypothetical protein